MDGRRRDGTRSVGGPVLRRSRRIPTSSGRGITGPGHVRQGPGSHRTAGAGRRGRNRTCRRCHLGERRHPTRRRRRPDHERTIRASPTDGPPQQRRSVGRVHRPVDRVLRHSRRRGVQPASLHLVVRTGSSAGYPPGERNVDVRNTQEPSVRTNPSVSRPMVPARRSTTRPPSSPDRWPGRKVTRRSRSKPPRRPRRPAHVASPTRSRCSMSSSGSTSSSLARRTALRPRATRTRRHRRRCPPPSSRPARVRQLSDGARLPRPVGPEAQALATRDGQTIRVVAPLPEGSMLTADRRPGRVDVATEDDRIVQACLDDTPHTTPSGWSEPSYVRLFPCQFACVAHDGSDD